MRLSVVDALMHEEPTMAVPTRTELGELSKRDLAELSPGDIRKWISTGKYAGDSWGLAPGFAQTAFVAVPQDMAFDFSTFSQRNPRPCPLLEVLEPGIRLTRKLADGADVTTSLSRYRIFQNGEQVSEVTDVQSYWNDQMVGFLIGCTGSFESHMVKCGVILRHLDEDISVPLYVTNRPCESAGRLAGPLAVSMRPIRSDQVARVVQLTSRFPAFHGAPVHVGNPEAIGIHDLSDPWAGDGIDLREDEVPVFWACSVTPQLVAVQARLPLMITNAPSCMFIADRRTEELAVSS